MYYIYYNNNDNEGLLCQVEDLGLLPVITVRDPRICRLWSRCIKTDFVVPKFKVTVKTTVIIQTSYFK